MAGPRHSSSQGEDDGGGADGPQRDPSAANDDQGGPTETVQIIQAVEGLPPEEQSRVVAFMSRTFQGPLPPAEQFAAYEQACPGAANEILQAARENRHHRIQLDQKLANTARLSLILTWTALIGLLVVALVFGLVGHGGLAGLFGALDLGAVLVALVRGGGRWTGK